MSGRAIARLLERNPSTISREIRRNACDATDGAYRPSKAQERTNGRRRRSRQVKHHGLELYARIEAMLRTEQWSPEQIAGELMKTGAARISVMTIYRHVQADVRAGGTLKRELRHGRKRRRKRTPGLEKRGRLQGKPMIDTRPEAVEWSGVTSRATGRATQSWERPPSEPAF
jgi:IS30 family transposase